MTELQVKAAQLKEDSRHNREMERLQGEQNQTTREHYQTSDTYTGEHYQRSDLASLTSANAAAMNAETNKLNYQLSYSTEHPGYDAFGYGKDVPLSAQKKMAEIEQLTLTPATVAEDKVTGYVLNYDGQWLPTGTKGQSNHRNNFVTTQLDVLNSQVVQNKTKAVQNLGSTFTQTLNSIFGKKGVIGVVEDE